MPRRTLKRPVQQELTLRTWGGKRAGAGRKPKAPRPQVPHQTRPKLSRHHPVHITLRAIDGLHSLRADRAYQCFRWALCALAERADFRVVHYSVQGNHLHLLVEAASADALSSGMRGVTIRLARSLNKLWGRKGRVFGDRYHSRALRTPHEVRRALSYVLNNHRRHEGDRIPCGQLDSRSSGVWFDGWRPGAELELATGSLRRTSPVEMQPPQPLTWLLRVGWRRRGLIPVDEVPRGLG
jgi:REP element-mobilizing transposase RayT